jgi:hypothetical protein
MPEKVSSAWGGWPCLHEVLGAGARDGAEVVDEVRLGHAHAGVDDGQRVVGLVRDDVDEELGLLREEGEGRWEDVSRGQVMQVMRGAAYERAPVGGGA